MVLHQIHCPLLPIIHILKEKVDSLQQWMKVKGTEPDTSTILCWHIKTGRDICLRFHSKVECVRSCMHSHVPLQIQARDNNIRSIGKCQKTLDPAKKKKFSIGGGW